MRIWTLKDSAGFTWYVYPVDGEFAVSDTDPSPVPGEWDEYNYAKHEALGTSTGATSGIVYLTFENTAGVDKYVYPHTNGSLIITDTEPT